MFSETDRVTELSHLPDDCFFYLRVSYMNATPAGPHSGVASPGVPLPPPQLGSAAQCPLELSGSGLVPPGQGRAGSDLSWPTDPGLPQHE